MKRACLQGLVAGNITCEREIHPHDRMQDGKKLGDTGQRQPSPSIKPPCCSLISPLISFVDTVNSSVDPVDHV